MATDRGRIVRADQRVVDSEPPTRVRWAQELDGTPFARILRNAQTAVLLEPSSQGTRVTVELDQRLRGMARFGGFMVRRAARRQLDQALDGLERLHV
jgi:carbon monoxide dehydrogenase subunit G